MSYHASMENIQQAQIELLKDHNIFMKTRHFYKIADTFLKNHDMTKDFDDKTRGNVIGGLLNLFGEQLVSFDYNVEDDVINEVLGGLFDKDKVGNEILRLLESDTGGYYGVGSDGYNYSDSPLIRLDRNGFDTKLEKMAGGNRELQSVFDSYKALGNGEKVLVGHLLVRDNELFNPSSFFVKTLLDESLQSESRTNVILGYMKGVQLVEPDYKQAMEALSSDLPVMAGRLKAALQLAEQIHNLKTVDGLTVTTAEYNALLDASHTELVDQEKKASEKYDGIEAVYSLSKEVEKDFKSEKLRTNSDKMWSFYTTLRPYEKELAAYNAIYEETVRSIDEEAQAEVLTKEKQSEKDEVLKRARTRKNHYRHMHELYERYVELKGYTVTMQQLMDAERDFKEAKNEDNKLEALKAIYRSRKKMAETESSYVQKLGLNDMKDWIAQADDSLIEGSASIDEYLQALGQNSEHVREEFDAFLDTQVFRVDGVKTKSTIKRSDKDEEEFPKEVAEAVLEIDKWIARNGNSLSRGNSETTFGADILSHPMRERLFVYYMVEKQFVGKATGADIAMAVNGYIPNLDKFKEAMEAPVYKIHQYLISAIKDSDVIRNHEFIRSKLARIGSVNLELLESSMRLLDDEKSDVSGQLERYKNSLKTDFSDVLAHHPGDKAVEDYAKAWEDRQKKLVALLKELEKLRALSQISDEAIIGKEEKFAAAQAQVIVVRDYITMLQAAETKLGDLEAGPGTKERLGQALGRKVSVRADSPTTGEKIDGYAAKVSKLTGLLSTADTKVFNTGVFATVNGVAALAKIITACFAPDYDDDHISVSDRLNEAEKILDSISAAAKPVAEMIKSVLKTTSATFTTVGGAVSGGVTAFTGLLDVGKTTSELISLNQAVEQIESDRQQTQSKSHTVDKKGKVSEANAKSERIEKERKRAEENTARMQKRKLETRRQQAAIKAVGGAVSMATALVPGLNVVGAAVGGVITAVGLIHKFYKEGENRDSTLDEFIGMEDILKEYRKSKGIMGYTEPEAKEKEDRAVIRKMILRKFHFSSAEEFFNDISMKYAQILYEQIFFKDDGTLVLGGDEAAIEERRKYTGLFPELKFGWPVKEGDPPYPSVDELAANLMKVS